MTCNINFSSLLHTNSFIVANTIFLGSISFYIKQWLKHTPYKIESWAIVEKRNCARTVIGYYNFNSHTNRYLNVDVWSGSSWDRHTRHSLYHQTQALKYFSCVSTWNIHCTYYLNNRQLTYEMKWNLVQCFIVCQMKHMHSWSD